MLHKKSKGFSLIEVVIAATIISLSMVYIAKSYSDFVALSGTNTARLQATFLLDEGVEAVKTMRGERWSNIASTTPGTAYHLIWNTDRWRATTTPQLIDGIFLRTLVFNSVVRDGSFNIAGSGTADAGSRQVDITVAWSDRGATTTKAISMYVFNIFE